jgi:hypothetical protein
MLGRKLFKGVDEGLERHALILSDPARWDNAAEGTKETYRNALI